MTDEYDRHKKNEYNASSHYQGPGGVSIRVTTDEDLHSYRQYVYGTPEHKLRQVKIELTAKRPKLMLPEYVDSNARLEQRLFFAKRHQHASLVI
eukprot:m.136285 g.136285  ORF g.136285 m.136285 type:complete len:94 (+) comp16022_c2_seq22:134-415(+)